jgi:hypothetical protein
MSLIQTVKHKIKRKVLKNILWLKKNILNPQLQNSSLTPNELKAITIASYAINNENSELSLCPITGKRYIKYNDYFIVIEENKIKIVNHVYGYDIFLHGRKLYNIKNLFDKKLYQHFKSIEDEILSNVRHSLDEILAKTKQQSS